MEMKNKVILISIDGMRPDGFLACGHPFAEKMKTIGSYTLTARTVFPSVTLPCHMSMFHSVPPERHGITTNLYMPPVHPFDGLFEQIKRSCGKCAMFYGWEPLRDIVRPGKLIGSTFINARAEEDVDRKLTDCALSFLETHDPDFVFLYLVDTDERGGHDNGWMTDAYLERVRIAVDCVRRVKETVGDRYTVIVTADHGGHDRTHGTEMDEDMTIPMFFMGPDFEPGKELSGVSLLDIAPTIADVMGVPSVPEWEGNSLLAPKSKESET